MLNSRLPHDKFLKNISQDCCFSGKFSLIKLTKEILRELSQPAREGCVQTLWPKWLGARFRVLCLAEALSWNTALLKDDLVSTIAATPFPLSVHSRGLFLDVRPHGLLVSHLSLFQWFSPITKTDQDSYMTGLLPFLPALQQRCLPVGLTVREVAGHKEIVWELPRSERLLLCF